MEKYFNVDDFAIEEENNNIVVWLSRGDNRVLDIIINYEGFISWLHKESRLEWEMNYSDETGSHVQVDGKFSISEYFADTDNVMKDIYDFICSNPISYQNQVHNNSVISILNALLNSYAQ